MSTNHSCVITNPTERRRVLHAVTLAHPLLLFGNNKKSRFKKNIKQRSTSAVGVMKRAQSTVRVSVAQ
jgi:hypothetical protein